MRCAWLQGYRCLWWNARSFWGFVHFQVRHTFIVSLCSCVHPPDIQCLIHLNSGCKYKDIRRSLERDVGKMTRVQKSSKSAPSRPVVCFHALLRRIISVWGLLPPDELQNQGVQEVFVFCTRAELHRYRVPSLLDVYQQRGFTVHHMPFSDGDAPELEQCCRILEELQTSLENNRKTVIQWAKLFLFFPPESSHFNS